MSIKYLNKIFPIILVGCLLIFSQIKGTAQTDGSGKWVGTWSCAPYEAGNNTPPSPFLANNTLRQIVRASIGGDTIRVKFSNITSSTPLTINSVNIAVSTEIGGSKIDVASLKTLTFGGSESVTMDPYTDVTSDALAFALEPDMNLAITIYYGQCRTASDMTHHYGSRTDSYILAGNHATDESMQGATRIERWYTINTIDVLADDKCAAIGVIGNSITDGYGLHGGLKNKWTDALSRKLLADSNTAHVSVLNMGIGATWLSTSGINRFQSDILDQEGLRWIIVFYGVNDIGGNASAATVINALKQMVAYAHADNIRIYGATITPFKGNGYYSAAHEAVRKEVNEWIRTPGNFDKCLDFDAVIRDPNDAEKMLAAYSNDYLHPNAEGYKAIGESVDINLFLGADTVYEQPVYNTLFFEPECAMVGSNWNIVEDNLASNGYYVTVKPGIESKDAAPIGDEKQIVVPFTVSEGGQYSIYGRVNCAGYDNDSYWIQIDDEEADFVNGLANNGWEWKLLRSTALESGEHNITIGYREDGAKLDKLCVTNYFAGPLGKGDDAQNICVPEIEENSVAKLSTEFLLQNYPNPFDSTTQIQFNIEQPALVSIKVYDSAGKEVITLSDKQMGAGLHKVQWNGSDAAGNECANGSYICKMLVNGKTASTTMLLLR